MAADPLKRSLYTEAVAEAARYKWIESEKAGSDLGQSAIEEWNSRHWWGWCRSKWLEHLTGRTYWIEFGERDFGALRPERWQDNDLLETIIRQIEEGRENLNILTWAVHSRLDLHRVLDILEVVDINTLRERNFPSGN